MTERQAVAKAQRPNRMYQIAHGNGTEVDGDSAQSAADLLGHGARDHNATDFCVGLQPRGDVDAGAVDVVILDDDVGDVDGHAESDAPVLGLASFARCISMSRTRATASWRCS